jgi:hypothetical protein
MPEPSKEYTSSSGNQLLPQGLCPLHLLVAERTVWRKEEQMDRLQLMWNPSYFTIKYSPGNYSRSYSAHLTDEETRGQKGWVYQE